MARLGLGVGLTRRGGGGGLETLSTGTYTFPVTLQRSATEYSVLEALASFMTLYTGSTIYVSPTGNDGTGDGSSGAPYLTFDTAYAAASNDDIISMASGVYAYPSAAIAKDLAIVRTGATGEVVFGSFFDGTAGTFVVHNTNFWRSTSSETVPQYRGVLRRGYSGTRGTRATWQANFQEVTATFADGYMGMYIAGTGISYFTLVDGSNPNTLATAGELLFWDDTNTGQLVTGGTATVLFGDNIVCCTNNSGIVVAAGTTAYVGKVEIYSSSVDSAVAGIAVAGTVAMFETIVHGSVNNAIDYTGSGIGAEVDIVSVNSEANASTNHTDAITLRVGGYYGGGVRTIHDVGEASFNFSIEIDSYRETAQVMLRIGQNSSSTVVGYYGDVTLTGSYTVGIQDFDATPGWVQVEPGTTWPL